MDYRNNRAPIKPAPLLIFTAVTALEGVMINVSLRQAKPQVAAQGLLPGVAAIVLGFLVLFVVGFAQSAALHNTAHDTRHAFAFPCH